MKQTNSKEIDNNNYKIFFFRQCIVAFTNKVFTKKEFIWQGNA